MELADSNKCFASGELTVPEAWCDYNGHLNVGYYLVAFDSANDAVLEHLGIGASYRFSRNASAFVLEAHVTYDREVGPGDGLVFRTQVLDCDAKRLHLFHRMYHAEQGYLAATNELMFMHVDLETRRGAAFPEFAMERIGALCEAHASLGEPAAKGRRIGIRRR